MNMEATSALTVIGNHDRFCVRFLHGAGGFEAIRPAWEKLTQKAEAMRFHHQYAWYMNNLWYLEPDPGAVLCAWVSCEGETVAIVPLVYRRATGIGRLAILQLPSHAHFCIADAVVRRGEDPAAIMDAVIRGLRSSDLPAWDLLLFPEVAADSGIHRGLRSRSRLFMVRELVRYSDSIPNVGGYEATAQRLSGSFRRDLRRKLKHAERSGALSYRSVESLDELEDAFQTFMDVEGSGWKGPQGAGTAIKCDPGLEDFYRGLTRARSGASHCVINLLYLDDTCIAAEFCLYCNGILNLLKIGYRESHARISPGSLLFDYVLRDWCERPGVREISFVGDAPWQKTWHPVEQPVYRYRVYNYRFRAMPSRLWRALRPLLVVARNWVSVSGARRTSRRNLAA